MASLIPYFQTALGSASNMIADPEPIGDLDGSVEPFSGSFKTDPQPVSWSLSDENVRETGSYVDDGSQTSAEKARDDNIGFLTQLVGSLTGQNQKILQDLMASATKAQYDFEERMSSSAYQRAVSDMKKAGLNPAVLFSSGVANAASTPHVGISNVATENQLLTFFSAAGSIFSGLGSLLNSLLGNLLPKEVMSIVKSIKLS